MRRFGRRLALAALTVPLYLPAAAWANPNVNSCAVTTGTIMTPFTLTCAATPSNPNTGTWSMQIAWNLPPCTAPIGTPVTGTLTGTAPSGASITQGAALTVITSNTVFDLNLKFALSPAHAGLNRLAGLFQYSCPTGTFQPTGEISELDAINSIPSQPNSAYCSYGNINGTASYAPPMGSAGSTNATLSLTLNCVGAPGSAGAGVYVVQLRGTDIGGCNTGNGSGTIVGTGPGGGVSGAWMYSRNTVHYYGFTPSGTGFITMGGHTYLFYLWLDVIPEATCLYSTGTMVGHGLIVA